MLSRHNTVKMEQERGHSNHRSLGEGGSSDYAKASSDKCPRTWKITGETPVLLSTLKYCRPCGHSLNKTPFLNRIY